MAQCRHGPCIPGEPFQCSRRVTKGCVIPAGPLAFASTDSAAYDEHPSRSSDPGFRLHGGPAAPAVCAGQPAPRRVDAARHRAGRIARPHLRRVECVSRAEDRPDRQRVDSDRRSLHHDFPLAPPLHDFRKQHRAAKPLRVLPISIFRWLGRSTILENNIVQTTGSAADSVSAGVVFTIPAILLMGYDLDIGRVAVLAIAGGLMGILMMIPLRRALIVKEHHSLPYPEGTACAEVLIAGEQGGVNAKTVFQAFGLAFTYKFLMTALKLWQEYPNRVLSWFK